MSDPFVQARVLQVLEATLGGTRRYLENIFDALGPGPHNGLAYSLDRADDEFRRLLEKLRLAGWSLYEINMRRAINPRNDFDCVLKMREIFRAFKPDIVHAHASKAGAIARLATLGMRRRPGIVYSPHAIGVHLGWIYRPIEHMLARRLDILMAVTLSEADQLRALNLVPSGRIHVVVPSINSAVFAPLDRTDARRQLGLGDGPLVIAVGRLSPQKDPLAFVAFFEELQNRIAGVRAIWVGDGELREVLTNRIEERGLSDVISIAGWQNDVRPFIAASDLLVSTAHYESFGYVTAEAMAMDRPVVASEITGTIDIVTTDREHQLYQKEDVSAAVELAVRLISDQAHAAKVAERGRKSVLSTFSTDSMRGGLARVYSAAARG